MTKATLPYDTIATSAAEVGAGHLSPVAYAEALLGRIAALDERLHSFIRVMPERALAQARAAESALKSGADLGPLHGIPYAAKDLFDVKGAPTTAGTRLLADNIAARGLHRRPQAHRRRDGSAGQDPHGPVRLWRRGHQPRSRHAAQPLASAPARTWRLLERQRGGGSRRPGAHGAGHRHGWIGSRARGAVRDRRIEDHGGTGQSRRGLPAVLDPRQRRADHPIRRGRGAGLSGAAGDRTRATSPRSESPRTMHCGASRTA